MEARRKSVQLISKFGNAAGLKSNIQKSSVFLYTSNEHVQKHNLKENLKLIQNEMLGHNLTEQVQNLHTENSKTLKTDIKDLNKWRDVRSSWIGRLNIV